MLLALGHKDHAKVHFRSMEPIDARNELFMFTLFFSQPVMLGYEETKTDLYSLLHVIVSAL